jgi:kynureninase
LDASDPMARYRPEFVIQDPDLIYMDGNSLGRLPIQSSMRLREVIDTEWGNGLVRGWNQGWFDAAQRVGEKIDLLLGAAPGQVLVCDSTSVNLFKLVQAALNLQPGRSQIVSDDGRGTPESHAKVGGEQFALQGHGFRQPVKDEVHVDLTCDGDIETLLHIAPCDANVIKRPRESGALEWISLRESALIAIGKNSEPNLTMKRNISI